MISESRYKRYLERIAHGKSRMELLERKFSSPPKNIDEVDFLLIVQKAYQEVVEVSTDVLSMMLKDSLLPPMDNYSNIDAAEKHHLISEESAHVLREANGLRNRIVHIYNDIDYDQLVLSIKRTLSLLKKYLEAIETWSSSQYPN